MSSENGLRTIPLYPPRIKKKLSSIRIWRDDKPLLDHIFERLGLDEPLNQSEKMGQLLQWIKELLEDEPKTSLPEFEAIEPSQNIPEIPPFQGELPLETTVSQMPPTQDDDNSEITIAVSSLDDTPNLNTTQTLQPPSQNVTASGLEAKIDKLVDVMTQFISFSMQSAIQPPTTPPTRATVKATTEAKPTITNEAAASEANFSNTITQQRSTRNSPEAEAAIAQAIDAIIEHNNATQLHDLKWAISINAVKELVSEVTKSQRLVDKAIKKRQAEIDAHHAQHQLEPSHNRRC